MLAGPGLSGYEAPNSGESDLRMWNIIKAARDEGPDQATALWLKDPFMAPAMEQAKLAPRLQKIARENAHCWLENPVLAATLAPRGSKPPRRDQSAHASDPRRPGRASDEGDDGAA